MENNSFLLWPYIYMKYSNNRKRKKQRKRENYLGFANIYRFEQIFFYENFFFFLAKLKRFSYIYFLDLKINIDKFFKKYIIFLPNKMNNKNKEFKRIYIYIFKRQNPN